MRRIGLMALHHWNVLPYSSVLRYVMTVIRNDWLIAICKCLCCVVNSFSAAHMGSPIGLHMI